MYNSFRYMSGEKDPLAALRHIVEGGRTYNLVSTVTNDAFMDKVVKAPFDARIKSERAKFQDRNPIERTIGNTVYIYVAG